MPANLIKARGGSLVVSGAKIATGNSGAITLPQGDSFAFYLSASAVTGTSPTADVAIQVTPDDGTTWFTALRFAQLTIAATRRINVQPTIGRGEAGAEAAIADTGGALAANTVLTRKIRVVWTIAGTNPSFTFALWVLAVPKQGGTY